MKDWGIKCAVFDFDGTLANTLPLIYKAMIHVFKTYDGIELTDEKVVSMFGLTEEAIIRKHLANTAETEAAVKEFYRIYELEHEAVVSRSEDIEGLLRHLKNQGMKLGVYTGKGRKSLDISLKRLGMESMFDVTVSGDDVGKQKPDPEGVVLALKSLGAKAEESIFIGDSDADMQAGRSAGVRIIGVQWLPAFQTHRFNVTPDLLFLHPNDFISVFPG